MNDFFRLYVETRPALHGLHFSFVVEQIFPSSGSFGPTFPSRGKALYVPTFPAQRISDNETAMMGQAEQYNARFSIRAVREYM